MNTPSIVRLASPPDEAGLLRLLEQMHAETGLFPYAPQNVRELVHTVLSPNGKAPLTPTIIGVVGHPSDLQASICITTSRLYYTDAWHLGDLWNFVRPDCRRSSHAKELLEFGKRCADSMGLPFVSGVVSNERTEAKMRLYRRRFGKCVGGYFLHEPGARIS